MKNRKMFTNYMALFAEIFDKEVSIALQKVYWQALEAYSDPECEEAFKKIVATSKFFPKPAEIINAIDSLSSPETAPLIAWGTVMASLESGVEPSDPSTKEAIRRVGGWAWLQSQSYDELHWIEKRFIEHYESSGESIKALPMAEGHNLMELMEVSMKKISG